MNDKEIRSACIAAVRAGYPVSYVRDHCREALENVTFEKLYSIYMQERHKALQGIGCKVSTFLF